MLTVIRIKPELPQAVVADIIEAVERAQRWLPLYQAVLAKTGSREQALAAVAYVTALEAETEGGAE